jgi:hypothetical protein
MHIRTLFPATLGLLVLAGFATAAPPADIEQRVHAFVESANQHDVDAMIAATEPGFRWMQVAGDRIDIEVDGHAQLRSWLEGYFINTPDTTSTIGAVAVDGAYASTVETVAFNIDGKREVQTATSVYEFGDGGLIRNVWYFPAQQQKSPAP